MLTRPPVAPVMSTYRRIARVLDQGKQGKPPLALAWGLGTPHGEREDRGKELCCVLLCSLVRLVDGLRPVKYLRQKPSIFADKDMGRIFP